MYRVLSTLYRISIRKHLGVLKECYLNAHADTGVGDYRC